MSESRASSCLFCRIARGELPSAKVFETEHLLAFLDTAPVSRGHTLLIPKGHYENVIEAPPEVLADLARHLPAVARGVLKATGAEGLALWQLNGRCAGQVVMHVHFHILPRSGGDSVRFDLPKGGQYAEGEAARLAAAIARDIPRSGG